ncbi:MAG: tetraacyldisaccharide 4'-kinase [Woeseiaceae bacterium]|nr:tetraacyldisaccharide 4'-kinase [Woeseiaceae bacterium]
MYRWIHRVWYKGSGWYRLLLPLAGIYWLVVTMRRALYAAGIFPRRRAAVPVLVVGNVTAGGTGKTPVAIWFATELRARGFRPGIVSRGYGGSGSGASMRVDAATDPALAGDEPVLLARRTGCPVVVDANRFRATEMLVADGVDVIIADDGLQHYGLERDYEICVIDGARGLGNRRLLPAGPLREPLERLATVDQVLVNGEYVTDAEDLSVIEQNAIRFDLVATEATRLDGAVTRPLGGFADRTVHAVAAIGNPERFFAMLRAHDMQVIEHAYSDHARLAAGDLCFGDDFDVLMTEKDAVKLPPGTAGRLWAVPVELRIDAALAGPLLEQITARLRRRQVPA